MKTFRTFLTEARRNPISKKTGEELNPKKPPVERLEKYKDDNDIFISFISNAKDFTETGKSGVLTAQVGLNTKSKYNTPNGIYTYPIAEVYDMYAGPSARRFKRFDVPFVEGMPKIAILRRKGKFINEIGEGRSYSRGNLAGDVKKMTLYAVPKLMKTLGVKNEMLMWLIVGSVIGYGMHRSSNKSDGGQFWNASRLLGALIAHAGMVKKLDFEKKNTKKLDFEKKNTKRGIELYFRIGTLPKVYAFYFIVPDKKSTEGSKNWKKGMEIDEFEDYLDPQKEQKVSITIKNDWFNYVEYTSGTDIVTANVINPSEEKKDKSIANPYANAWANLLVNTGYDSIADRRGHGIIHQAEPVQAVFLSRRGYDVVDIIDNKSYKNKTPHAIDYKKLDSKKEKVEFIINEIIENRYRNLNFEYNDPDNEDKELTAKGNSVLHSRISTFYKACNDYKVKLDRDVLEEVIKKHPEAVVGMHHYTDDEKFLNYFYKWAFIEDPLQVKVLLELEKSKLDVDSLIFAMKKANEIKLGSGKIVTWVNKWYELKKEVPLKLQLAAIDIWPGSAKYFGDSKDLEAFEKILKSDQPDGIKGYFMNNSTKSITDFSKDPKFEIRVIDIIVNDYFKDLGSEFFKQLKKETEEERKNKLGEQYNYIIFNVFRRKLTSNGEKHLYNRVYNYKTQK